MCSGRDKEKDCKDILEWELSLDSQDLRAHAWYHGNINRQQAESLLKDDGDFLVRDCSSSGRTGDFVLSCRWESNNLHFLIHKDVLQRDTIYEQLRYRFESDSFDTVPDLITYHVGSGMTISEKSGAMIISPRNRTLPISQNTHSENSAWANNDYALLAKDWNPPFNEPTLVSKTSTLERTKPAALNLQPKSDTLEDLNSIPEKIAQLRLDKEKTLQFANPGGSNFDLNNFESILLPASGDIAVQLSSTLLEVITSRIMEASDRSVAQHITKMDWEVLLGEDTATEADVTSDTDDKRVYDKIFHESQHRWNNVIERSLTLTHFVVCTILRSDKPEDMLGKWIRVSQELKTSMGNFFSFSSIMRGLLLPSVADPGGKINWFQLRRDFTEATFTFETTFRKAYQGFANGSEDYPPNTTIPDFFPVALILEDNLELLFTSCPSSEDDTLHFLHRHLNLIRSLSSWAAVQRRNMERHLNDISSTSDIILQDLFRTEFQLSFLWGLDYTEKSLKCRCDNLEELVASM